MADAAPIVVHPPLGTGGRRVTVRNDTTKSDVILGLARSDRDVVEFLRRAGLPEDDSLLDDPSWVEWRGADAHQYEAA